MAIYAIFNVAIQYREADVRMCGFFVEQVYCEELFVNPIRVSKDTELTRQCVWYYTITLALK